VLVVYGCSNGKRGRNRGDTDTPGMVEGLPVPSDEAQQVLVRPPALQFISVESLYRGYTEKCGTKMTQAQFADQVCHFLNDKAMAGPGTCTLARNKRMLQYDRALKVWTKSMSKGGQGTTQRRGVFLKINYDNLTRYVQRQEQATDVKPADLKQSGRVNTEFLSQKRPREEEEEPPREGTMPMDLDEEGEPPKDKEEEYGAYVSDEEQYEPYYDAEQGAQPSLDACFPEDSPALARMELDGEGLDNWANEEDDFLMDSD
jgi:hypothetical protein